MAGLVPATQLPHGGTVLFLQRRWKVEHVQPVTEPPDALGVCLTVDHTRPGEPGILSMILIVRADKRFALIHEERQICTSTTKTPPESD